VAPHESTDGIDSKSNKDPLVIILIEFDLKIVRLEMAFISSLLRLIDYDVGRSTSYYHTFATRLNLNRVFRRDLIQMELTPWHRNFILPFSIPESKDERVFLV
jgi:hypothetical protein